MATTASTTTTTMSCEKMAAKAYSTPAITPTGVGPAVNAVIYVLTVLGTIVLILRVWVRCRPGQARSYDDAAAVLVWLLFIPANVFGVMATYYGLGTPDSVFVDSPYLKMRGAEYTMYFAILYMASSTATKIAINLAVLRLARQPQQRHWRTIVISNLALMLCVGTGGLIFLLADCIPFSLFSNPFLGTCRSGHRGFLILSYVGSSVQMITDWVSALVPLFIISQTQMPLARKVSVIAILMLGILASIAAMLRIVWYRYWDETRYPTGYMGHTAGVVIWSELEAGLGIIACSAPPLRRLVKSISSQFSLSSKSRSRRTNTAASRASRGVNLGYITRETQVELRSSAGEQDKPSGVVVHWKYMKEDRDANGSDSALV